MKVNSAKFIKSAVKPEQYPDNPYPEIAFAGRSNVGKSSLINSLTGRKGLVKVSKTPGKTQLLNFFSINDRLTFVDMPGYGFANVPLQAKKSWGQMVETYLETSGNLKAVVLLLDCRREPNEDDRLLLSWLNEMQIPLILVFTKIDKIPKTRRAGRIKSAMSNIGDMVDSDTRTVTYSSLTGEGKRELWSVISDSAGLKG